MAGLFSVFQLIGLNFLAQRFAVFLKIANATERRFFFQYEQINIGLHISKYRSANGLFTTTEDPPPPSSRKSIRITVTPSQMHALPV